MNEDSYFTTVRGMGALRAKLKKIKEVDRPQNVRDIEEARAHGDLSENAEYHAAKERQGFIDRDMRELEDKIGRAHVVDPSKLTGDTVVFGATVTLLNVDTDEEVVYQVVGEDEVDLKKGRISYRSPIARAIIGRQEGDDVEFQSPGGTRYYEILTVVFI